MASMLTANQRKQLNGTKSLSEDEHESPPILPPPGTLKSALKFLEQPPTKGRKSCPLLDAGLELEPKQPGLKKKMKSRILLDTDVESISKVQKQERQMARPAKINSKEIVNPMAWNRSEVSSISEAGMIKPTARRGRRSESKVSSMRSSLFKQKIGAPPPESEGAEEENDSDAKKREEALLKRMADLDVMMGVN